MNLARLQEEFARNFTERGELGASVSVWQGEQEVITLAHGWQDREGTIPFQQETPVLFWSATKGLAAACLLHAAQEFHLSLDTPVAALWPEFAQAGKERITMAELLSHRAGLAALAQPVPVMDYSGVVETLAAQPAEWHPREGSGYHPRTWGYLLDELLRRITGRTMQEYWHSTFAEPLDLELWMGVPDEVLPVVAPVFPPTRGLPKGDPFYTAFLTSGSLTSRAFASPRGLHAASQMNTPEARQASLPAFGGIGTARGLARFYALLAGDGTWGGRRWFHPETLEQMRRTLVQGSDKVLLSEKAFSAGFMRDPLHPGGHKIRQVFGPSLTAFGQPGAGGSNAFADPEQRLGFAYVMNQMEPGVLPGEKCLSLIEALYEAG